MKISVYVILLIIKFNVLFGQNLNNTFYKMSKISSSFIFTIDNKEYELTPKDKSEYSYFLQDDLVIDSVKAKYWYEDMPMYVENNTIWNIGNKSNFNKDGYGYVNGFIYKKNSLNEPFKLIFQKDSFRIFYKYQNFFIGSGELSKNKRILYSINLDGKITKILDLENFLSSSASRIIKSFQLNDFTILIYTGFFDGGAMDQEQYFVFNLTTKKLTEVTEQMKKLNLVDLSWYNIEHQLPTNQTYDEFQSSMFNNYLNGYLWTYEKILDQDFNIVTPVLNQYIVVAGYNYKNNQFESFNLRTWLDDKSDAIIPYRFDINFEKALYKIYTNELIVENDLKQIDSYFYPLLKNFIYAKHNYQFEKEYYQAFFNLFQFYRIPKEKRSKKVEGKFTKADKENLKLILTKISQ